MVFISYSKDDLLWKDKIIAHLKENETIHNRKVTFYDADIEAGHDFQKTIEFNVASVKVAILLVSNNYLKSEYIKVNELEPFLRRRNIRIYWFLLSSCLWNETKLSVLQCANTKDGGRIITFNEMIENNKAEQVNQILSLKCKEVYDLASKKNTGIQSPLELIYKCNRNAESQLFKMVYTDCYTEKDLLAYSILGDKDDSLKNLHNAIKLKVLVNDYKNYDIQDIVVPFIETTTLFSKEQNLLLFKTELLSKLDIPYEASKLKGLSINNVYQQLRKQLTRQSPKQIFFISIKVESTAFYEETFLTILNWLNTPTEPLANERYSLKIFFLFIFEKSNIAEADQRMISFLGNYCKETRVENIIRGGAAGATPTCLQLIFLGEHRLADRRALSDWYERDYKQQYAAANSILSDDMDTEFENVKEEIFGQANEVKMRIVDKNLTAFLKH